MRLRCRPSLSTSESGARNSGWSGKTCFTSSNATDAERRQYGAPDHGGEALFLLVICHEQAVALVIEIEIDDVEYAHSETDLGPNRIQIGVERLFGDAELGQANRQDTVGAPDKERQGSFHGRDL